MVIYKCRKSLLISERKLITIHVGDDGNPGYFGEPLRRRYSVVRVKSALRAAASLAVRVGDDVEGNAQ